MKGPDHYRFEDSIGPDGVTLHCRRFVVIGETPCCYYVLPEDLAHYAQSGDEWRALTAKKYRKRVLKNSWRRYCYPDVKLALESYRARKSWQTRHAAAAAARAEAGHAEALALLGQSEPLSYDDFRKPRLCAGGDYFKGLNWGDY